MTLKMSIKTSDIIASKKCPLFKMSELVLETKKEVNIFRVFP